MGASRKGISKRTRFEVFKRDQFRCQYCGGSAPDVLLVVDHIVPVAKGGSDGLLNLITACGGCNAGKSDVPLSDTSAVKKQLVQARVLAERREQLEMLVRWRDGLQDLERDKAKIIIERVDERLKPFDQVLNEYGMERVRGWLKKFGLEASLHGIASANESDPAKLIEQMERYAAAAQKVAREPELREFWRIRARLRGLGFRYGAEWQPIQDMRRAFRAGCSIAEMDAAIEDAENYSHFLALIGG